MQLGGLLRGLCLDHFMTRSSLATSLRGCSVTRKMRKLIAFNAFQDATPKLHEVIPFTYFKGPIRKRNIIRGVLPNVD